jgi:hypothetical protein
MGQFEQKSVMTLKGSRVVAGVRGQVNDFRDGFLYQILCAFLMTSMHT